jgi:HK97 family phage prohead protease/HK97 family phage major capsid protein
MSQKLLHLSAHFKLKDIIKDSEDSDNDVLQVSGYASTNDLDRQGDVVESTAWKGGLKDYAKNPIVLAFHDHTLPIGKTVELENDDKGLLITAEISKAAGHVYDLVKEGILSTFSVGFIAKDGDYDEKTSIFAITKAELFEISVVSVPANAAATFSVSKNFDNQNEFDDFKKEFIKPIPDKEENTLMEDKDKHVAPAIDTAAIVAAVRKELKAEKTAADALEAKAKEDAASRAAAVQVEVKAGIESLAKDLTAAFDTDNTELTDQVAALTKAATDQKEELEKYFRATGTEKAIFDRESTSADGFTKDQKDTAVILGLAKNKNIKDSVYFQDLVLKSGMDHWEAGLDNWEIDFNTNIHNVMRENLVVETLINTMPMNTKTMNIPINPEATYGTWIDEAAFRSTDGTSTGAEEEHLLDENSITAFKLASKEYIGYEETEDTIVAIMPIIRDAIARRMSRSSDKAILRGVGGISTDPIAGLTNSTVTGKDVDLTGGVAWGFDFPDVLAARQGLGLWGDDPANLVLLVSSQAYYKMLDWADFKTVNTIGQDKATYRTGAIGNIGGIDVVMSRQFDNAGLLAGTTGTAAAVLVNPSNFIIGNLRNTLTESARDIEDQKNIIVSTRRFGMVGLTTGQGAVGFEVAA